MKNIYIKYHRLWPFCLFMFMIYCIPFNLQARFVIILQDIIQLTEEGMEAASTKEVIKWETIDSCYNPIFQTISKLRKNQTDIRVEIRDSISNDNVYCGITAHRGNSKWYPENTIPAFLSAIYLKVDWVELDIQETLDGYLVVSHDGNTHRTGDSNLEIAESNLAELLKIDIAAGFRSVNRLSLSECPPQQIPLLEEVLKIFIKQDRTRLSIQPKTDCVDKAIDLILKLDAEDIVGFNDGNLSYMSRVKELNPDIPVFWDRPATTDINKDLMIAKERGFESIVINHRGVTEEKVDKIKTAGLEVGTWTVNEIEEMNRLMLMGVDRIYTDDPYSLIELKYMK